MDDALLPDLSSLPMRLITDKYLENSQLRLRKIESDGEFVYKFCKKYGKISEIAEPITNLYLSQEEYQLLAELPGRELTRQRYTYPYQGVQFSINVVVGRRAPVILEAEFESEADACRCEPPSFCAEEISSDPQYEAVRLVQNQTGFQ